MPWSYQAGRSLEMFEESIRKPLLLSGQSFSNHIHGFFVTNAIKPAFYQTRFLKEDEIVYDQLLLETAKELMTRRSCEGELSIHQMMRKGTANRSSYKSFNYLLEEIINGMKKLESYSEFDEDSLDYILERDLYCFENAWESFCCKDLLIKTYL